MTPELLALENEAEQLKSDGRNDEAIAKLLQALELDEKFARVHLALSVLYHKTEDYEKSVAHAERAVELEPDDAFNVAALSVTYQRAFEGTRDPIYIQKAEEALARTVTVTNNAEVSEFFYGFRLCVKGDFVIPAKAGIQLVSWSPAFAGMT